METATKKQKITKMVDQLIRMMRWIDRYEEAERRKDLALRHHALELQKQETKRFLMVSPNYYIDRAKHYADVMAYCQKRFFEYKPKNKVYEPATN